MMLIMTLLDMIGVASIFPFILILTNSDITETNIIFVKIFEVSKIFGIENSQQFSFFIGILFFVLLFSCDFNEIYIHVFKCICIFFK